MNPSTQHNPSDGEAISLFDNAWSKVPEAHLPLALVAEMIQEPGPRIAAVLDRLERLRSDGKRHDDEYKEGKKHLPAVTFAGRFPRRKADQLERHSGYVVIDFDEVDDAQALRDAAFDDPAVALSFVSPSQDGCKIVIAVEPAPADAAEHAKAFSLVVQHVRQLFDVQIDMSGSDVSRLCFLSRDPDLRFRPDPRPLRWQELTAEQQATPPPQPTGRDDALARAIDRALSLIPADDYEEWLQIGQALHAGGHPLALWESWSATSDKYREGECGRKWAGFDSERGLTMGTFWEIAKRHGYEPRSAVYDATRAWSQAQRITPNRDEAESYARRWNTDHGRIIEPVDAKQVGREAQMDEAERRDRAQDGEFRPPTADDPDAAFGQVFESLPGEIQRWDAINNAPGPTIFRLRINDREIRLPTLSRYPTARDAFSTVGLDIRDEYERQRGWKKAQAWLRDCARPLDNREENIEIASSWLLTWIRTCPEWLESELPQVHADVEEPHIALASHALTSYLDRQHGRGRWSDADVRLALLDAGFKRARGYWGRTPAYISKDDILIEEVQRALAAREAQKQGGNQPPS